MRIPSRRPTGTRAALALLALTLAPADAAPARAGTQDEMAGRERAGRWSTRNGVALAEGGGLEDLVERAFLRVELGAYELAFPAPTYRDPAARAMLATLAGDLLDLEERWAAWRAPDPRAAAGARPATKRLRAWLVTWSKAELGPDPLPTHDLAECLAAAAPVREASAALGTAAGASAGQRARLVLLPTRAEFVEFAAAAALVDPGLRAAFWAPGPEVWTEYTFAGRMAVALEYASPRSRADYRLSISMNAKNPRGAREHVAVLAAGELLDALFEPELEPLFAGAVANLLVIELFGELDTRADGDLRAHVTPGRSVFVPGGKPQGGKLPPNRADSRWRALQGKDHFVGVLAASQAKASAAATERWERSAGFSLCDDAGQATTRVFAPFLGAGASAPPSEAFEGDYLEFLRAYRVAFLHWLRERSAPGTGESQRRFAELLAALGAPQADLLAAFKDVYGKPLSAAEPSALDGSLEGAFLAWLSHR